MVAKEPEKASGALDQRLAKALAHPLRVRILEVVNERPISPAAFTRELDQAADQSRQGSDLAPLQRFIAQWAIYVHIQRQPDLASDLRRWEDTAESGDAALDRLRQLCPISVAE